MDTLRLWLHLDAFDMAQGGAWEWWHGGTKLVSQAYPAFPQGEKLPEAAATWLAADAASWRRQQLRLFP